MRYYAFYPADPDAIREHAFDARSSSSAVHRISDDVAGRHQGAVAATDGEMTMHLATADGEVAGYSRQINRAAIWAALQLETFCDAIEVFNTGSVHPMSISRLNECVSAVNEQGILDALCVSPGSVRSDLSLGDLTFTFTPPAPSSTPQPPLVSAPDSPSLSPTYTEEALEHDLTGALQSALDAEYDRLLENLDAKARAVAQSLENGPTEDAILHAWKIGNLPPYAALAWPSLNLDNVPIIDVDSSLLGIDDSDVPGILTDYTKPLTDAELEWLRMNFPEQMREFEEDWDTDHTLPAGASPEGLGDVDAPHGWILGPDGHWYPVQMPLGPADDPWSIHGDGWTTVESRLKGIEAGPDLAVLLPLGTPELVGPQSVGGDQEDFWGVDKDGNLIYGEDPEDRLTRLGLPPGGPYPESDIEKGDYPFAPDGNPRLERFTRAGGAFDLAIVAGENILYNQQLNSNREFAGGFTFQETPGGDRRVVIQLGQAQYDPDTGEVTDPYRTWGRITEGNEFDKPDPYADE